MRMYDIIRKKRDGMALEYNELKFFVDGYVAGNIPDYQAAALLMAAFLKGLSRKETVMLTKCMEESGDRIDLTGLSGIKVDKHSTGGVGDKTSIVLAPLIAAAGVPVAKMSGRGLGHTGGTIDKLESIPGFKAELSTRDFVAAVNKIGVAITGQTGNIAPGDKKLYVLRDVTATVDSIPLIASSIMSKKLAAGADCILLDVKVGSGAFMKDIKQATELAETMVYIGNSSGRRTMAVMSDMDQPLGRAVGNALEVKEAIDTLRGEGPEDFTNLCMQLAAIMLMLGGKATDMERGREMADHLISSGKAAAKFEEFVKIQGGDPNVLEYANRILPKPRQRMEITSDSDGYIERLDAEKIGIAAMMLGAGRSTKEDIIDPAVGVVMQKKLGDPINKNEAIATLHISNTDNLDGAVKLVKSAVIVSDTPPQKPSLIKQIIE